MMTYASLRAAIKNFLLDSSPEIEADLDFLIRLGEVRIYREADLRLFKRHAFTSLSAGDYWLELPTDCMVVRDLRFTGGHYLENVAETFIREVHPDPGLFGNPKYYAQWDQQTLMLAPTPEVSAQVEMTYTFQPPGLSLTTPSTWLSSYAEDLLLYAILVEASVYKQGMVPSEAAAKYTQSYQEALQRVVGQEQHNRYDEFKQRGTI
jgi:hypothetical protein